MGGKDTISESSNTKARDGSTRALSQAMRNTSGAGLPWAASSPLWTTEKKEATPVLSNKYSINARGDDEATAQAIPASLA